MIKIIIDFCLYMIAVTAFIIIGGLISGFRLKELKIIYLIAVIAGVIIIIYSNIDKDPIKKEIIIYMDK